MEDQMSKMTLHGFELSDIDDIMVWETGDLVLQFTGREAPTSREIEFAILRDHIIPHPWYMAICLNSRVIGSISVMQGSGEARCRGELGYVLASHYWGQGLATCAVKMVISNIFEEIPELERLEALVDVQNVRSQRVLERVGFVKDGLLRKYLVFRGQSKDMLMYSFLSSDVLNLWSTFDL
ncbi:hypothetical protein AMTRI_Chr03g55410 [Amborella trichopoda]